MPDIAEKRRLKDPLADPAVWFTALCMARRAGDFNRVLECARELLALGVRVSFVNEGEPGWSPKQSWGPRLVP
jgi:hypothetical protein